MADQEMEKKADEAIEVNEDEQMKRNENEEEEDKCSPEKIQKSISFKEESSLLSDLKENEKKALEDLRKKLNSSMNKNGEEDGGDSVNLWGVKLALEEGGDGATEVILLKFLRAREFKVEEAEEMFRKTLKWRKEKGIEGIVEENIGGDDLKEVCYISGSSREGRPVCYNVHGGEIYKNTLETEEKKERFLRWRIQRVEEGIRRLDFRPGGVSSFLQINDLKDTPGVSKKELRLAIKHAVDMLQDNYPELVARNIFINVPFWYYAFAALQSQFLTQRTRSKFVFARPSRVTETLLKYIGGEEIPVQYGGLKRGGDGEFGVEDKADEVVVKAGGMESIEIATPEVGSRVVWDLGVVGWDVKYKEEFVPSEQGSYVVIIQRERKVGWDETAIRNSFTNREAGKIVLVVESGMFKKKRVLFRYKVTPPSPSS